VDSSTGGVQDVQRLGHRPVLTTWDAIAQSLAIGPIFSSAFVAFLIAGSAGGAAPLSTLIGAVGVLALGWLISLYARRGGGAGAIYPKATRGPLASSHAGELSHLQFLMGFNRIAA
jgi:hypothetical protein